MEIVTTVCVEMLWRGVEEKERRREGCFSNPYSQTRNHHISVKYEFEFRKRVVGCLMFTGPIPCRLGVDAISFFSFASAFEMQNWRAEMQCDLSHFVVSKRSWCGDCKVRVEVMFVSWKYFVVELKSTLCSSGSLPSTSAGLTHFQLQFCLNLETCAKDSYKIVSDLIF